jgi:hypothetical protein
LPTAGRGKERSSQTIPKDIRYQHLGATGIEIGSLGGMIIRKLVLFTMISTKI